MSGALALAAFEALPAFGQARRPNRGRLKPGGVPRINFSHPLAQKLELYAFDTGLGPVIELVKNRPVALGVGSGRLVETPTVFGQVGNSVNDTLDLGIDSTVQAITAAGGWTAACACIEVVAQGVPFGRTANNFGSSPFANWNWEVTGANTISSHWNNGGALTSFAWASAPGVGGYTSLAIEAVGTASVKSYGNGALVNTTTGQTIQSTNTNDHVLWGGGSAAAIAAQFDGFIYYGGFWSRNLTDAEVFQLHVDPYAFLIFPGD